MMDTAQKEGYAMYYVYSLIWEHLLKDRKFPILTDHRNLRYLRETMASRAECNDGFDYTLVYLSGYRNIKALLLFIPKSRGPDEVLLAHTAAIADVQVPQE